MRTIRLNGFLKTIVNTIIMNKNHLIVAHPDDEVLWFNPLKFDKIFIVFLERDDSQKISEGRKEVLKKHPLKNIITSFGLKESGFEGLKSFENEKAYRDRYDDLIKKLKGIVDKNVVFWTHNPWGEYGQCEHLMVHQAVVEIAERFGNPVYCFNGIDRVDGINEIWENVDLDFVKGLKTLYMREGCWTYDNNYQFKDKLSYFKVL